VPVYGDVGEGVQLCKPLHGVNDVGEVKACNNERNSTENHLNYMISHSQGN
jgi:hypothetical protein